MNKIKTVFLTLLALSVSIPAFGEDTATSNNNNTTQNITPEKPDCRAAFRVTVPNQEGGLSFGGDALYWRVTAPNLAYLSGVQFAPTDPLSFQRTTVSNINPTYHWGFDAFVAYRIPCTGNDISLTWTHFDPSRDSSFSDQAVPIIPDVVDGVFNSYSSARFQYDAVDLDLGQKVNLGDYFLLHFFTGARLVDVQQSKTTISHLSIVGATTPLFSADVSQRSQFRGIGPQFGVDGRYCLGYGFGIDAGSTLSVLVGRVKSNADDNLNTIIPTPPGFNTTLIINERKNRVIPAWDGNLGLDYIYNFNNCQRSSIVVQAGYKVIHYWGITHFLVNTDPFVNSFGLITGNSAKSVTLDGPYVGIKVNL